MNSKAISTTSLLRAITFVMLCYPLTVISFAVLPAEINWREATNLQHWSPRAEMSLVTFNGRLFLYWFDRYGAAYNTTFGDVWQTDDGVNWSDRTNDIDWVPNAGLWVPSPVLYQDKLWDFGSSSGVRISSDGLHWEWIANVPGWDGVFGLTVFRDQLWAVGRYALWRSDSGATWEKLEVGFDEEFENYKSKLIVFNQKLFFFGEDSQAIRSSSDGLTWNPGGVIPGGDLKGRSILVFAGRIWLLGGSSTNQVWSSADGVHWEKSPDAPWAGRSFACAIVFHDKLWIMGGRTTVTEQAFSDIWCTSDGVNWECIWNPPMWSRRNAQTALTFEGKIWVFGGVTGFADPSELADVWYSENGLDWHLAVQSAAWPSRSQHTSVVFHGNMWVMGGHRPFAEHASARYFLDDVWTSGDGKYWIQLAEHAAWGRRRGHAAAVFHDRMWLLGGYGWDGEHGRMFNDVWSSADGIHWTVENASAAWAPREEHGCLVFQDTLWVLGGIAANGLGHSDIWRTDDGRNWELVLEQAPWVGGDTLDPRPPRAAFSTAVWGGRMWVIGGSSAYKSLTPEAQAFRDVWSSTDGEHWTASTPGQFLFDGAPWGDRFDHSTVVFQDRLWLLGGYQTRYQTAAPGNQNDVWFSYTSDVPDFTPVPTATPTGTPTPTPTPGPEDLQAFVLDDFGAVHAGGAGGAVALAGGAYFGWNVARDMDLVFGLPAMNAQHLGVLVLDGYGAVHSYSASRPRQDFYFAPVPGDVAVDLAVFQKDLGGTPGNIGLFVLDRFGKVWSAGEADWKVARSASIDPALNGVMQRAVVMVLRNATSGWLMDNMGRVTPFGGAADPAFAISSQGNWIDLEQVGEQVVRMDDSGMLEWSGTAPAGWDLPMIDGGLAVDLEVQPGYGLLALDRYGALHATPGAILPPAGTGPPYFGFEAARDLEVRFR